MAQVSINTDGSTPDASAMLEVKSTDKGILIPRLTTAQRTTVSNPATGLLVYDSTTNSFWFYSGTAWTELTSGSDTGTPSSIADADDDTKIEAHEDSLRFEIAASERMIIELSDSGSTQINLPNNNLNIFVGQDAGRANVPTDIYNGAKNNFIGYQAGYNNTTGSRNIFMGYHAGYNTTTGHFNTFLGNEAGYSNTTGISNTFIGTSAGYNNSTGFDNALIGNRAGQNNTDGHANAFLGNGSGFNNTSGERNTNVGTRAGYYNQTGSNNVFLGYEAGLLETGSNKLYIENSQSTPPLIYGEFDNDIVKIHGTLGIGNSYTFPTNAGTAGQVLQTDGAGNTAWAAPTPLATIADVDNDTKIQVEESQDEDKVRIDLAGSERLVIEQNTAGSTLINLPNNNENIFLGVSAGNATIPNPSTSTGIQNSFLGYQAGSDNTTGSQNTFFGYRAGQYNTTGKSNVFNGVFAGENNETGSSNIFIGTGSGGNNLAGSKNVAIGGNAGRENNTGSHNTFIGFHAGTNMDNGDNNIFIGSYSGKDGIFSNRLFIDIAESATPLIYGEFDNDLVKINGQLSATQGFADSDNDTKIQVEESADEDKIRFDLDGSERVVLEQSSTGATGIILPNNNDNIFLGNGAGDDNSTGHHNIFLGIRAGDDNTTGQHNIFMGFEAGNSNQTGNRNILLGAGNGSNSQNENVMIGYNSGGVSGGDKNTYLGTQSGGASNGNNNVFLGYQAGFYEFSNDKLFIENSNSTTPLIYGDFLNDTVKIHGTLGIKNEYIFPPTKGTAGQVLQTDDVGNVAWISPTDDQKVDIFHLNGTTLELSLEDDGEATKTVDLASIDNQKANVFQLNGTTLELSLEDDGEATKTVDLASIDNQKADVFQLNGTTLELSLEDDGEAIKTADLASINTDNQKADVFQLNGNNLELSIENDGVPTQSVDLSVLNTSQTLITDEDNDTKIQVEESANEDNIRMDLAGSERVVIRQSATGGTLIDLPNNNSNTFLGQGAGQATTQALGGFWGKFNNFIGYQAGYNNTDGVANTFSGNQAGLANTTGSNNTMFGFKSGFSNTTGSANVLLGYEAGISNTTANNNVNLGFQAGFSNSVGNSNVFIGHQAGFYETGSNKLYIENSGSSTPLIYGDFDANQVEVNGEFDVNGNITFGSSGVLQLDDNSWQAANIRLSSGGGRFGFHALGPDELDIQTDGDVYCNNLYESSDRRLKENIRPLTDVLQQIQKLQGYRYNRIYKTQEDLEIGFVAQEVQAVFPEMVTVSDEETGYLAVNYIRLIPVLLEAIKEQQENITSLQEKVVKQENTIQTLSAQAEKINALESLIKQIQSEQTASISNN